MLAFITAREIADCIADSLPEGSPTQHDVTVAMRQAGFASCCSDAAQVHQLIVDGSPSKRIAQAVRDWIKLSPGKLTRDQAVRATALFCDVHGKLLDRVHREVIAHLSSEDR